MLLVSVFFKCLNSEDSASKLIGNAVFANFYVYSWCTRVLWQKTRGILEEVLVSIDSN